jgi:ketosteroid isomerase-like protein
MRARLSGVTLIVAMAAGPLSAQVATGPEAEVLEVVNAFHGEMKKGNSTAVAQLLAPDVLLLEAGGIETRAEYEKDHLPADIEFEKEVTTTFAPYRVTVVGDAAWVVNRSEYKGTFRGRAVDSLGVELMVLARDGTGWRIRAIHWSSRPRSK